LALLRRPRGAALRRRPISFWRVAFATIAVLCGGHLYAFAPCARAARPLEGTVRDQRTLLPVPHALIELLATGEVVQADADGRFRFESLPDGNYTLCARRIGYLDRCDVSATIGPEEVLSPVIYMSPRDLQGQLVEVVDSLRHTAAAGSVMVTREEIVKSGANTVADVLERTPDVEILRESNGTARVSIRGSRPEGVKVLVDNVPLAGSGMAVDVSSISASDIESIEIIKGPAVALVGSDALAGAVLITTRAVARQLKGAAGAGWGSFNTGQATVALDGAGIGSQRFGGSWNRQRTDGDFTYFDSTGQSYTRLNNESDRKSLSARGQGQVHGAWGWQASFNHFQLRTGMPGAVENPKPEAEREESRYTASARLTLQSEVCNAHLGYAYTDDWNYYLDTGRPASETEYDTRMQAWNAGAEGRSGLLQGAGLLAELALEDYEGLDHRSPALAFGNASRTNWGLGARWHRAFDPPGTALKKIQFDLAYRYDRTLTEAVYPTSIVSPVVQPPNPMWEFGSPHAALAAEGLWAGLSWNVTASYSKAYRRPPLFDQFWVEAQRSRGNPGLRPERSGQFETGYGLLTHGRASFQFEQRFYWSDYLDLIYWRQLSPQGAWVPDNIGSARIDGREETLQLSLAREALSFRLSHLFSDHKNTSPESEATFGQPLPYRYRHRLAAGVRGSLRGGWCDIAYRWFDRSYVREAASKWIEPYGVLDAVVGLRRTQWHVQADVTFKILNITNESYEVIEREPMPGRNYALSIQLSTSLN
jgi:outer membrane cobalamin receptor